MATLAKCFKKHERQLSAYDVDQIKGYFAEYVKEGTPAKEAKRSAVMDYVDDLMSEYDDVVEQVEVKLKEPEKAKVVEEVSGIKEKTVSVEMTKAEEKALSPKEQKAYLLEEIDKAIEEAPDKTVEIAGKHATDKKEAEVYKKNMEEIGTVTIEVPDDGVFNIFNAKQALKDFKKIATKFPVTEGGVQKPRVATTRPSEKRLVDFVGYYYHDYSVRKEDILFGEEDSNYYTDGFYSNGMYFVKTDKKPVIKGKGKKYNENNPDIKSLTKGKSVKGTIEGESYDNRYDFDTPIVVFTHVTTKKGDHYGFNAAFVDSILTKFPDAKPYITENGMMLFKDADGNVVGGVMRIQIGDGNTLSDMTPAIQEGYAKKHGIEEVAEVAEVAEEAEAELEIETPVKKVTTPEEFIEIVEGKQDTFKGKEASQLRKILANIYGKKLKVDFPNAFKLLKPETKQEEEIEKVLARLGTRVVFVETFGPDKMRQIGGLSKILSNIVVIQKNPPKRGEGKSNKVVYLAGHEFLHTLELQRPDLYNKLIDKLKNNKALGFEKYKEKRLKLDKEVGLDEIGEKALFEEYIATFTGLQFTNKEFVDELFKDDPTFAEKLVKLFKDILDRIYYALSNSREDSQFFEDVVQARNAVADIIRESGKDISGNPEILESEYTASLSADTFAEAWHSQMSNFIKAKLSKTGSPKEIIQNLKSWAKKGLIKEDELSWSGVIDWLETTDFKKLHDQQATTENIRSQKEFDPLGIITRKYDKVSPLGNKVTKQDVLDYLAENNVQVEEVVKGEQEVWDIYVDGEPAILDQPNRQVAEIALKTEIKQGFIAEDAKTDIRSRKAKDDTKFARSELNVPGGENYRELLLTLPERPRIPVITEAKRKAIDFQRSMAIKYGMDTQKIADGDFEEFKALRAAMTAEELAAEKEILKPVQQEFMSGKLSSADPDYTSTHWEEKNVLAHVRFDERTDAEGNRVLFIEEIQSDWHQAGRKEGYKGEAPEIYKDGDYWKIKGWASSFPDRATAIEYWNRPGAESSHGVTNAPFKKTWPMLAMKRMVRYAAENGFDKIAWTPGDVQADRYDLSKQVSRVYLDPVFEIDNKGGGGESFSHGTVVVTDLAGNEIYNQRVDGAKAIEDLIGKDPAERLINNPTRMEGGTHVLQGDGLKVGGTGMKGFYDKILPAAVNKFFNKPVWGKAKVGTTKITVQDNAVFREPVNYESEVWDMIAGDPMLVKDPEIVTEDVANLKPGLIIAQDEDGNWNLFEKDTGVKETWSLPITKEMKDKALEEGMPMFSIDRPELNPIAQRFIDQVRKDNISPESKKADRDLSEDGKVALNFASKVWTNRKKGWKEQKEDTTVMDRIVSIPMHHFEKVPALKRMFEDALKRSDNYYETFRDIDQTEQGESSVQIMKTFQKQNKEEYKKFKDYLVYRDRNQIGYRVWQSDKTGSWYVFDPNGDAKAQFRFEKDALDASIAFEASDFKKAGYSDQATQALMAARRMTFNGFDILVKGLRDVVAKFEKAGEKLPEIAVMREGERVKIDLKEALIEMGDMRGYYMPRVRKSGRFSLKAEKKGENPILEFYDSKSRMAVRQTALENKGYTVTKDLSRALPEDVFQMAGEIVSMQAIINQALDRVSPDAKDISPEVLEEVKKALPDVELLFAKSLAEQIANVIKTRGHRAHMVKRSKAKGKDVWIGYEEDPIQSLAKYGRGIAAGEAKKKMAFDMVRHFTGTDYSWEEYKEEQADLGKEAEYKDYIQFVRARRVDPTGQPNAFKEGKTYMEDMLRNEEFIDRTIGTLKGLAVMKYLAGRVSAPIVNLTALITSVPAAMNGYANISYSKFPKLLGDASVYYGRYKFGEKGELDPWVRKAFQHGEDKGWFKAQYNREALSVLRSKIGRGWDTLMDYSMFAFGATEELNRASTIVGTYMGIKDNHKGTWTEKEHKDALEKGKKVSDKAHAVYGKANRPHFARGSNIAAQIAQAFYVFRTFSHNYLLTMKELGFTPGKRHNALFMALSPAVISGVGASVLTPVIAKVLSTIGFGGDDPEEALYTFLENNVSESADDWARYGLFGLGGEGISLKGSLQIGITDIPTTIPDILGAPGSIVLDIYQGGESIARGDVWKGTEKILPLALSAPMKAYREKTEGVTTKKNAPVFYGDEQLKADYMDALYRALSFNPSRMAGIREKQWKEKKLYYKYQDMRSDIYSKLKRFYLSAPGDRDKGRYVDILNEIREYNARVKDRGLSNVVPMITDKSIKASVGRSFKPSKRERTRFGKTLGTKRSSVFKSKFKKKTLRNTYSLIN